MLTTDWAGATYIKIKNFSYLKCVASRHPSIQLFIRCIHVALPWMEAALPYLDLVLAIKSQVSVASESFRSAARPQMLTGLFGQFFFR